MPQAMPELDSVVEKLFQAKVIAFSASQITTINTKWLALHLFRLFYKIASTFQHAIVQNDFR